MEATKKVLVIGGGPVGALAALYAARRGYQVELHELRDDPNFGDPSARPSIALIPLDLSERGIRAIASAGVPGLIEDLMDSSIPIHRRMVHDHDKHGNLKLHPIPYGLNQEVLHTLPREKIAKRLLLALQKEPTANVIFNHKLISCDFAGKTASFEKVNWKEKYAYNEKPSDDRALIDTSTAISARIRAVSFDFVIGCDGSYSTLRQGMMKHVDMDFHMSYIHAKWCDFVVSANPDGGYRLNSESLHVWPDKESIVVAQPNFDGSFRAGMVIPAEISNDLKAHHEKIEAWFRDRYPGIIPNLMSAQEVTQQFVDHQHISLKSIKCGTFGYEDSAVLLGDSAHSMTPFHAMGMITGLEDVRIMFEDFIDPAHAELSCDEKGAVGFCPPGTLQRYTEYRRPDVHAMTDMAEEHYNELRFGSRSKISRAFKAIQSFLQRYIPALGVATLYTRIQFSHERFSTIRRREDSQKKALKLFLQGTKVMGILGLAFLVMHSGSQGINIMNNL